MRAVVTRTVRLPRVMGCRGNVTATAPDDRVDRLLTAATARLQHLERCWSRFLPNSDVSRINRSPGRPVPVDRATITLLVAMAAGARATGAMFDPTLLGAIVGLGYGPAWPSSVAAGSIADASNRLRWIDETLIDPDDAMVTLADGVQLDPGAIGKGLAADVVAEELIELGAESATVDVGGDVRITAPTIVGINDPGGRHADRLAIGAGGVATSGTARRWVSPSGADVHHALDPRTRCPLGRSGSGDIVQVSVAAMSAADAEVHATALLVDGTDERRRALDRCGLAFRVVTRCGACHDNAAWRRLRNAASTWMAVA